MIKLENQFEGSEESVDMPETPPDLGLTEIEENAN